MAQQQCGSGFVCSLCGSFGFFFLSFLPCVTAGGPGRWPWWCMASPPRSRRCNLSGRGRWVPEALVLGRREQAGAACWAYRFGRSWCRLRMRRMGSFPTCMHARGLATLALAGLACLPCAAAPREEPGCAGHRGQAGAQEAVRRGWQGEKERQQQLCLPHLPTTL